MPGREQDRAADVGRRHARRGGWPSTAARRWRRAPPPAATRCGRRRGAPGGGGRRTRVRGTARRMVGRQRHRAHRRRAALCPGWDATDALPVARTRRELAAAPRGARAPTSPASWPAYDEPRRRRDRAAPAVARRGGGPRGGARRDQRRRAARSSSSGLRRQLRHDRQPRRRGPGPATPTLERHGATLRQLVGPPGGVGRRPRRRGAGRRPARSPPTTPSRCSAPRPAPSTRCPGRGGALRRAGRHRLVGVGPAAPGRHVAAHRRRSPSPTVTPRRCRCRRCAASPPTPTPACAGPRSTPSWRRGRRSPPPAPRR